jgi:WD40 repeat protein
MSDNLPNTVIVDHILPFVDRSTWENLIVANREIYEGSRKYEAPWPVGKLRGVGYGADEIDQICYSSGGKYLCVLSSQNVLEDQQKIRVWHKVVGSCGHITFDGRDRFGDMSLWRVCFSPVENLLVSLHQDDGGNHAFRLWEVNTGGLVFKEAVRLDEWVDLHGCTFSRDGRQLILYCENNTLRIYSVPDAQLIKVIHLVGDFQEYFSFDGITADGRQVAGILYGMHQLNRRVCLWDVHGDGSTVEHVCVSQKGEVMAKIAISPLDDSIAIMTGTGIIKLAHRRARDVTWTVEVVADGKCFDTKGEMSFSTSGQLLATVRIDGGVEIWDPIKGQCLRTIVCDLRLSMLKFSPDGSLLAATTDYSDRRLSLYTI